MKWAAGAWLVAWNLYHRAEEVRGFGFKQDHIAIGLGRKSFMKEAGRSSLQSASLLVTTVSKEMWATAGVARTRPVMIHENHGPTGTIEAFWSKHNHIGGRLGLKILRTSSIVT
ncbi:hypothetical protein K435DRAFT_857550 [Dendrothele bispora CBS 962.96]|uniref:Uncharacterized protein n=1 Tax=Dendrothele bispora (strain CBS 962.96) TaxID=1314807 RepID=A0A4S8M6U5_DENBC|nr:hypothetical protein K435DRAFT_857550 [Dendrothele bispora CBS 962.96]